MRELNKNSDAISALNRAIELDPQNTNAYINKTKSLLGLDKYEEAIQTLDKGIQIVSDADDAAALYYEKAKVYAYLNDSKNAIQCLTKCIEINPNYKKVVRSEAIFSFLTKLKEYNLLINGNN